jgi:hypothetical protein
MVKFFSSIVLECFIIINHEILIAMVPQNFKGARPSAQADQQPPCPAAAKTAQRGLSWQGRPGARKKRPRPYGDRYGTD